MSKVLMFAKRSEPAVQVGTVGCGPQVAAVPNAAQRIARASQVQAAAKRGIIIALFQLELVLNRCRDAIAQIPEWRCAERRKLDEDLRAIDQIMIAAQAVARSL